MFPKTRSRIFGGVNLCVLQPLVIDTFLPDLYKAIIACGYEEVTFRKSESVTSSMNYLIYPYERI